MRITLQTKAGRQSFENVVQLIVDQEAVIIWCKPGKSNRMERNKRMCANCIDMHVEITDSEKENWQMETT